MHVQVNGKETEISDGKTVAELAEKLGLAGRPFAVEINGKIIPKAQYRSVRLRSGDRLEVVEFVGGG